MILYLLKMEVLSLLATTMINHHQAARIRARDAQESELLSLKSMINTTSNGKSFTEIIQEEPTNSPDLPKVHGLRSTLSAGELLLCIQRKVSIMDI